MLTAGVETNLSSNIRQVSPVAALELGWHSAAREPNWTEEQWNLTGSGGRSQQRLHKQSGSRCFTVLSGKHIEIYWNITPTTWLVFSDYLRGYLKLLYSMLCRGGRLDQFGYWPIVWQERDYCPLSAVTDIPLQGWHNNVILLMIIYVNKTFVETGESLAVLPAVGWTVQKNNWLQFIITSLF